MANFGVTPVDPAVLMKMLEKQIQENAGLNNRAFLSLYRDRTHLLNPIAPQFCTIRPNRFPVWQSVVTGSGPTQTGFDASFTLTAFAQISSDPEQKSINAISEDTISVTVLVMKIISAAQFWQPKDSDGNDLLREYARIDDSGASFDPVDGKDGPWVVCPIGYQVRFTALLS